MIRHRWLLPALMLMSFLATTLTPSPSSADGSTKSCEAPKLCVSPELFRHEVARGTEKECGEAVARGQRIDEYRTRTKTADRDAAICWGRNDELLRQISNYSKISNSWRAPAILRIALDVGLVAGGIAAGAAVGTGAPPEWIVGFAVGAGALLVGRLVVEWLEGQASRAPASTQ